MEDRASKEEKAIGVDTFTQDDQVKEEFSHIIDRNHLSKREYYWLWGRYACLPKITFLLFFLTRRFLLSLSPSIFTTTLLY